MSNDFAVHNSFAGTFYNEERTPGGRITCFDRRVHTEAADGSGGYPSNFAVSVSLGQIHSC